MGYMRKFCTTSLDKMKPEIRVIGFDDAPFKKFGEGTTKVIGVVFRGGLFLDGVISTEVKVDGNEATAKLIALLKKTKFVPQLQAILLKGISFGGFNVIDIDRLYTKTGIPVLVVMRKMPDIAEIKKILLRLGKKSAIKSIERAGRPIKEGKLYVQSKGLDEKEIQEILTITCTRSDIPEPVRVAHLIAQGITFGESRGKA